MGTNIPAEVLQCIEAQRASVIAAKMLDGTPHGKTIWLSDGTVTVVGKK